MGRATMLPKIRSNRRSIASPAVALRRLRGWAPPAVHRLLAQLSHAGGHPVLVGGAVRDSLLGVRPKDWDIAVDMPIEAVVQTCKRVVRSGEQHGTVMVLADGFGMEVTTLRGGAAAPGASPQARLLQDLQHRDLTLNAMAVDLQSNIFYDPTGGAADLAAGRLRFVDSAADRLAEDPLRGLRALRFVSTLGLQLRRQDLAALTAAVPGVAQTAWERRRDEMLRLLVGRHRRLALHLLQSTGLLEVLAPELTASSPQLLQRLGAQPGDAMAVFAAWAWQRQLTGAAALDILVRWRVGKTQCTQARRWVDGARQPPAACNGAALRSWVLATGPAEAPGAAALLQARWPARYPALVAATQRVCRRSCVSLNRLRINGHDLRALGVPAREVGPLLQALLALVVEVPARNRLVSLRRLAQTL